MYYAVQKVCNENHGVWSGLIAFANAYNDFEGKIADIEDALETQEVNITGIAKDKGAAGEQMIDKAIEVANAVFAYASDNNDLTLKGKVDYSRTDLSQVRDAVTLQRCEVIKDTALDVLGSLGTYGINGSDVVALQNLIEDFALSIAAPRTAITERKGATSDMVELFSGADIVLDEKMDKLAEQFKATDPHFYKLYFDARIIVDRGVRHTVLEGVVVAAATGDPIAGALVELAEHEGTVETDAEGKYRFERVTTGSHTLRVSIAEWLDREVSFSVSRGRVNQVNVELVPDEGTETPEAPPDGPESA